MVWPYGKSTSLWKQTPKRNMELVITSPARMIRTEYRTKLGKTCFVESDLI